MIPRTPYQDRIAVLPGEYPELAIAFRSQSEYKWRDIRDQVNVAYLSRGLVTSYQPLSYTSTESNSPAIFKDSADHLFVSWLEKTGSIFNAYITTTDSVRRTSLDTVSSNDYLYLTAEGLYLPSSFAIRSKFFFIIKTLYSD